MQGISEEISRLESQQKGNDEMRRQIDEVIAYQQSRSLEKELQLKIEQVIIFCQGHMTGCGIHTEMLSFLLKRVAHWHQ